MENWDLAFAFEVGPFSQPWRPWLRKVRKPKTPKAPLVSADDMAKLLAYHTERVANKAENTLTYKQILERKAK